MLVRGAALCKPHRRAGRFLEQDARVFRSTMDLNYFGTVYAVRAVLPRMVERRAGHLVLVASAAAVCGARWQLSRRVHKHIVPGAQRQCPAWKRLWQLIQPFMWSLDKTLQSWSPAGTAVT